MSERGFFRSADSISNRKVSCFLPTMGRLPTALRGAVSPEKIMALGRPMAIDGYLTKPAEISVVTRKQDYTVLAIRLFEGRNRQIRKMCEALELKIMTLKRVAIGELRLGNLAPGEWRYLTRAQVDSLKK